MQDMLRATVEGYRSAHAFPLRLRQDVIGAIGVFASDVRLLAPEEVHVAQALAHVATIGH